MPKLEPCSACGADVSNEAKACPACGHDMRSEKEGALGCTISVVVFLLIALLLAVFYIVDYCTDDGFISTDGDLGRACVMLRIFDYDYSQYSQYQSTGSIGLATEEIDATHPGPEKTREYCESR